MKNTCKHPAGARVASKTQLPIRRFAARALAITAVILTGFHGPWADAGTTYSANETLANFGTVNQFNVSPTNGEMSCVPTATMNSFIFLQNEYPAVFGNDANGFPVLQGGQGSWENAAALLGGASYMKTAANNGTTIANWIGGKVSYLNKYSPVSIIFDGMDSLSAAANRPLWDTDANPTVNFLLQELQANEDVELGIYPDKSEVIGHALTLTGLTWIDADNSLTFDLGDTLTLNIMDPANPNGNTPLLLKPGNNPGDPMIISGGPYNNYVLEVALAESVPEPTTASLLLLGAGALLGTMRLRRRSA